MATSCSLALVSDGQSLILTLVLFANMQRGLPTAQPPVPWKAALTSFTFLYEVHVFISITVLSELSKPFSSRGLLWRPGLEALAKFVAC